MVRNMMLSDLYRMELPGQPALSPDAGHVVYTVTRADAEQDGNHRSLWIAATIEHTARRLTTGPDDSNPTWSPDGSRLLFLRSKDGVAQLWSLTVADGAERRLTDLPLGAGTGSWSPDGRRITFTAPVDMSVRCGDGGAAHRPMATDRLDYQADGEQWRRAVRQHVHVMDVPSDGDARGSVARLTAGDWDASAPSWSPDGERLAFTAAMDPAADLNRTRAVYLISAQHDPNGPRRVGPADGRLGSVRWIDRDTLLAGGRTDTRSGHDTLWRIDVRTGRIVELLVDFDRSIMRGSTGYPGAAPQLVDGGSTVLFCAREAGCTYLYSVPAVGGTPRLLIGGAGRVVSGMSTAAGRIAVVMSDPSCFGEVVVTDTVGADERVCTQHMAALGDVLMFERTERTFVISDGTRVHGWLMRDPAAPGPLPLLLDIHGGPHNAWNGSADPIHLYQQILVAKGWAVLMVNPRASDGYGEEFYTAAVGGWGRDDAQDFLQPLDQLVAEGIADPERLAVTGYSYGGFMTCYLTAHDQRFAAAVTGGPVVDLVSDSGTSDEGHYLADAEIGTPWWFDPDKYWALSPLRGVADVRTPTLILQGNDDVRCPRGQAQQWFTGLRERLVPTRLVLYPGSSHLFPYAGRPSHRMDYNERVVDWLERFAGRETDRTRALTPRRESSSARW